MPARDFSGRIADVEDVETLAEGVPSVIDIYGAPGVGKSALAVHVAHRLLPRIWDIQLYADLGEQNGEVPTAEQILQRFLADLDPATINIPVGSKDLPQRYRSQLSGRSCLILLDNAQTAEQVAHLIPGSGNCVVLITSRVPLATLEGVSLHHLDLMSREESLILLSQVSGRDWSGAQDKELAHTLVGQCGRLPLALRIAGAILKKKRHWPLQRLVDELSDERTRLARLAEGSLDVRSSFEISYRNLPDKTARAFRLLSLLPLTRFEARHAGVFLEMSEQRALRILEELVDVQLLETTDGILFGYHDLLRLFARERCQLAQDDPGGARREHFLAIFTSDFLEAYSTRLLNSQWSESNLTNFSLRRRISDPDTLYVKQRLVGQDSLETWLDVLRKNAKVLVVGGAGTGKTVLADRICYEVAGQRDGGLFDAAFTVALRRRSDQHQSLERLIRDSVVFRHNLIMPSETLELLLDGRRTLIVFDGLDELTVSERARVRADVTAFCTAHPQTKVVVTSRPGTSTADFDTNGFVRYELALFSSSDIHRYLTRWTSVTGMPPQSTHRLLEALGQSAPSADWLSNPLLLAQLAAVYEQYGFLPRKVSDLYRSTYELLFTGRESLRGLRRSILPPQELGRLVCYLAYEFVTRPIGMGDMSSAEFLDTLSRTLHRLHPDWGAREAPELFRLLAESDYPVRQISGGFAGEGPWWALVRDPFGQYLAARCIVDRASAAGDVVTRVKRAVSASGFVEGAVYVAELLDEFEPNSSAKLKVSLQRELDEQSDSGVRESIAQILRLL
ncbi:NB-ARC domain-containing protein [Streptomyces gilvifuscus]|uniref:NB-ARC domain-containing protein n=1 Tax=Streptomyces gilvifuscus TaxID=1550617 RepID=A0ABT5G914_9ACTN|nr:NB-ARC domain-containing protein [Streptomyces gilvifuscus]MDC2961314.1 NB-ARC domain-containing protein [Streptomyces gilvifuscus]